MLSDALNVSAAPAAIDQIAANSAAPPAPMLALRGFISQEKT
jgi:hypothetical protein